MKVYAIEINNICGGEFCGEAIPNGTLCAQVDFIPNEVYEKIGNYFISTNQGVVSYFKHKPSSTGGFANREITLDVKGMGTVFKNKGIRKITFKGTLWHSGKQDVENILGYRLYSIGLRTGLSGCYCAYCVTQEWIDKISRFVNIGEPQQPIRDMEIK